MFAAQITKQSNLENGGWNFIHATVVQCREARSLAQVEQEAISVAKRGQKSIDSRLGELNRKGWRGGTALVIATPRSHPDKPNGSFPSKMFKKGIVPPLKGLKVSHDSDSSPPIEMFLEITVRDAENPGGSVQTLKASGNTTSKVDGSRTNALEMRSLAALTGLKANCFHNQL